MSKENNGQRKKYVITFIITLIFLQGLYVIFPLPEIWPNSNYPMYSGSNVKTVTSMIGIKGVKEDGSEINLIISKHFYPMNGIQLNRGVRRILESEKYKNRRVNSINNAVEFFDFLPVKKEKLRELIGTKIVYSEGFEEKEKALDDLSSSLLEQYKYNSEKSYWRGENFEVINELRLYRVYWDWTGTDPGEVIPDVRLLYSTESGMVKDE